jgi:hypothetical protein
VRQAARLLLDRTKPDPLATALLGLAVLLLVVISTYWIIQGKAPPPKSPPSPRIERVP